MPSIPRTNASRQLEPAEVTHEIGTDAPKIASLVDPITFGNLTRRHAKGENRMEHDADQQTHQSPVWREQDSSSTTAPPSRSFQPNFLFDPVEPVAQESLFDGSLAILDHSSHEALTIDFILKILAGGHSDTHRLDELLLVDFAIVAERRLERHINLGFDVRLQQMPLFVADFTKHGLRAFQRDSLVHAIAEDVGFLAAVDVLVGAVTPALNDPLELRFVFLDRHERCLRNGDFGLDSQNGLGNGIGRGNAGIRE